MKKKLVAIIGYGKIHDFDKMAAQIRKYDKIIAVDGGLSYCKKMGLLPDLVVGDFDSVSPEDLQTFSQVEMEEHPCDKDHSDLEIAINKVFEEIGVEATLFGALEGRTDHTLYNLALLCRHPMKLKIETENETLYAISDQIAIDTHEGQRISLLPLYGPVKGITTKGLKWELQDATFDRNWMSLSNVALGNKVTVQKKSGDLICCIGKN